MTPEEIEDEINVRVEFKMRDVLSAVKNQVGLNWGLAWTNTSQKHTYYWEAFQEFENILVKEIRMPLPEDRMAERKRWEAKEKAVKDISRVLEIDRHYYGNTQRKRGLVADIIEEAQRWK